ncbi:MAG: ABC transporter ATP-binding protein [Bacteroidales bacterium]|nr:ABC transporter ATP-binding protein [Bacteroidales bacterium]
MKSVGYCLRAAIRMSRPARWRMLVSFLVGLVQIAASLSFVWISKALVDVATGDRNGSLWFYVILMASIMLAQIILRLFAAWWEKMNVVKTQNILRRNHFSHVLFSTWRGKELFHSADTVNRLEEDIRVVTELLCVRIPDVFVTVCQLVAASIYAIILAPGLIWIVIALMIVAIVGSRLFFRKLRRLTDNIRKKDSRVQQLFQDNLRLRDLVLMLFGPSKVMGRLDSEQKDIEILTRKRLLLNVVARGFMGIGFMGGYAAAFFWGVFGIAAGTVTYGMMTAMLQLVGQVQRPISDIGRAIPAFIHAVTSIERLSELTDLQQEDQGDAIIFDNAPQITLSNISFSYPDSDEKVLNDFSWSFPSGSLTAIMGATGAGKSTLLRIVMGLLKPSAGSAILSGTKDGKESHAEISAATRENFMYVPQGNTLLSGTIRENLLLVDPQADDSLLKEVLQRAEASFVLDLPEGLDTKCGEDGSGLSEGQCQRIAIARALLKKGGVLLLDEATSALDSQTEHRLLENICNTYRGKKTIIFISHREAVAVFADNVLRFQ